jgi:glycosyltransferase involved in cell wall biosynthesis
MSALRLSVVMPVYNSRSFVGAAIDSILTQSFGDFVFHIVDDGSTDGSGDIIAEKAAGDSRIQLIRQDNRGIVASLNRMLALVDAPFVARMDADDIALPERFERQLERMEADAQLGALGTQFVEIDEAGRRISGAAAMPIGTALVHAELEQRQPIANPTAMFRTQALRDAGLYREAFRYCEDYDLFLRLSQIARIDNLPDQLLLYRRSPGQMSVLNHGLQTRQAAYARLAHRERLAGRPDPFAGANVLPKLSELDRVLGRPGVAATVEAEILFAHRYAVASMNDAEFADYCSAVALGTEGSGLRAVARCFAGGRPWRAFRLAAALIKGRLANRATDG